MSWWGCSWFLLVFKCGPLRKPLPEHMQLANCYRPLPAPFLFFFFFNYLFLAVLSLHCCLGLPFLQRAGPLPSRGVRALRCQWLLLLMGARSRHGGLIVEAPRLKCSGSVFVVHGLSCSAACGIFLDLGEPVSPALAGGFFTTVPAPFLTFPRTYFSHWNAKLSGGRL